MSTDFTKLGFIYFLEYVTLMYSLGKQSLVSRYCYGMFSKINDIAVHCNLSHSKRFVIVAAINILWRCTSRARAKSPPTTVDNCCLVSKNHNLQFLRQHFQMFCFDSLKI